MMYLIDTNIFLEILLKQNKNQDCKVFLSNNIGNLFISDFSLHSIGVILFRQDYNKLYKKFIEDVLPEVNIVTLPKDDYSEILKIKDKFDLDFDDSYQYCISDIYNYKLVTLDKDFVDLDGIDIKFI